MQKEPLGRVLGLGSAKSGTWHFMMQRITALFSIPFVLLLIFVVKVGFYASYERAISLVHNPFVWLASFLFLLLGSLHLYLGCRVIVTDYVHATLYKRAFLLTVMFCLVVVVCAGIGALVGIGM